MSCFNDFDWVDEIIRIETPGEFIIDLIDSSTKEPYEDGFLYRKGDVGPYFYRNDKTKYFYFDYHNVYGFLNSEFGIELKELKKLIGRLLEKCYGLNGYVVDW